MNDPSATLVAVATPPGRGGVGCVRLSGPDAYAIAERLFTPASSAAPGPGRVRFGRFRARDGSALDHGYLVAFAAGASFTGEETAELWAHGSPAVLGELVAGALAAGATAAGPGEFTYRALRHGRLDLARAEAVRDLVAARTVVQARVAFAQADGALSRALRPLHEGLADLLARGEAAVEFVEESETHLPYAALAAGIAEVRGACARLLAGYRAGRLVREGATAAITGLPNAGKSSLFNRLLLRERAIVAEQPGTTRDTLEETLDLDGVPLTLIDTAGLRDADDPVESEGVRRARQARDEADVVVLLIDAARDTLAPAEAEALATLDPARSVVALNKCDLAAAAARALPRPDAVRVSARTGDGVGALRRALGERVLGESAGAEDPLVTDARHADALEATADALDRAAAAVLDRVPEEMVLEDVREALRRLGGITGEFSTEAMYDRIFSTFCIGK